jgi:hypothetical protein
VVWRGLTIAALAAVLLGTSATCVRDREMPETVEMPDSMPIMRALERAPARDSMLDTMPGGEMARGDSTAATRLLRDKIGR